MRTRSPLVLTAAAALAFGAVACEGEVDEPGDVVSDTRETGEDDVESDPGLEPAEDGEVTEDDGPVDDPAGVGDDEG